MSRGWPSDLLARVAAGPFHAAVLVRLEWPSGVVRLHTGAGMLPWNGHDWIGVGEYGFIQMPQEEPGLATEPGRLTLGGLPAEIEAELVDDPRGGQVDIWFATVTAPGGTVLETTPGLMWCGLIDSVPEEDTPTEAGSDYRIDVLILPRASQRALGSAVFTRATQQARYPLDTSGRWADAAVNRANQGVRKWIAS